jgi:hypothetical protein
MRIVAVLLWGSVLLSTACARPAAPRVNAEAQVLADFQSRISSYLELRKKADDGAPALKRTDDGGDIRAAQRDLAERIRAARSGAKQGAIFSPPIARHFRRLLRPELKDGDTVDAIRDDNPGAVRFAISGPYPDGEPLSTVPANVLAALPELPPQVEYRFVGKHLILRDTGANIVLDYIPNVLA